MSYIPLGIFAVAGAGSTLVGAMEHISTQTVGATGTVTFSSIPQDYKHIKLIFNGNDTVSTNNWSFLVINLNGDFGANYVRNSQVTGFGSGLNATTGTYSSSNNYAIFENAIRAANTNVTGPQWTYGELFFANYNSTTLSRRTITYRAGIGVRNSAFMQQWGSAQYNSGAAVSSITLRIRTDAGAFNNFGSWQSGSSFSLYGYRG